MTHLITITSKLCAEVKDYELAKIQFEETLNNLDLTHLDLYLMYAPWSWGQMGKDYSEANAQICIRYCIEKTHYHYLNQHMKVELLKTQK